jgi:hypothetical protein
MSERRLVEARGRGDEHLEVAEPVASAGKGAASTVTFCVPASGCAWRSRRAPPAGRGGTVGDMRAGIAGREDVHHVRQWSCADMGLSTRMRVGTELPFLRDRGNLDVDAAALDRACRR